MADQGELADDFVDEDVEDYEDLDDLEDATKSDIDFTVGLYREDGQPIAVALVLDTANDLDELIEQLRRLPGDSGALGVVSIAGEFFVLCRVRGRNVQALLSDSGSSLDWPLARDVAEYLGLDAPDEEDDSEVWGDLDLLSDWSISDFDLENIAGSDDDSAVLARQLVEKLRFAAQFDRAVASFR